MPATPHRRVPIRRLALALLAVSYLAIVVSGFLQMAGTTRVTPSNSPRRTDWREVSFDRVRPADYPRTLELPGRREPSREKEPAHFDVDLPASTRAFTVHLGITGFRNQGPPSLRYALDGRDAGRFEPDPDSGVVALAREFRVADSKNLRVTNEGVGRWTGNLLLIPHLPPDWLRLAFPPFAAALILAIAWNAPAGSRRRIPVSLFFVMAPVYAYSLFSWKLAPLGGLLFSDSAELATSVVKNQLNNDMQRHMLFLPVVHTIWWGFGKLGLPEIPALVCSFASISALNASSSWIWLRRVFESRWVALWISLAVSFSFAVWAYGSMYESYVFSALMVNLFLIVFLGGVGSSPLRRYVLPCVLAVLCGLSFPPLLVLVLLPVLRVFGESRGARSKVLAAALMVVLVPAGFVLGQFLIRSAFTDSSSGYAGAGVSGELRYAQDIVGKYAGGDRLSWHDAGNVVVGQFVHAFAGRPLGTDWDPGWSALWDSRFPGTLLVELCLLCLAVAAAVGASSRRRFAIAGLAVLTPYLAFFWYFNPDEMLLYSAPLVAPILAGWAHLAQGVLREKLTLLLGVTTAVLVVSNSVALLSYS